jgi:Mrp family chromosome partitioning ATPase
VLSENIDVRLAVTVTNVPGVCVLPAGPESANPSALLVSRAMRRALEIAESEFDHVILDTPPVFPLADVLVFGAQTDGVVLCVKGGRTPRQQVARVRDRLLRAHMRILGVVINELSEEFDAYSAAYPEPGLEQADRDISSPRFS